MFLSFFFQTSLQNPGIMILRNISFHGSNFAQNISTDLYFYMCLEDFKSVGIEAPLFGTMCFVLVYAIPGKTRPCQSMTNSTNSNVSFLSKGWNEKHDRFSHSLCNLPCFLDLCCVGFVVVLSYIMMGRTLCARKPPFDCDGAQGSASSQQVSRKFWNLTIWRSDRLREKSSNAEESNWRRGKDGYARLTSI